MRRPPPRATRRLRPIRILRRRRTAATLILRPCGQRRRRGRAAPPPRRHGRSAPPGGPAHDPRRRRTTGAAAAACARCDRGTPSSSSAPPPLRPRRRPRGSCAAAWLIECDRRGPADDASRRLRVHELRPGERRRPCALTSRGGLPLPRRRFQAESPNRRTRGRPSGRRGPATARAGSLLRGASRTVRASWRVPEATVILRATRSCSLFSSAKP